MVTEVVPKLWFMLTYLKYFRFRYLFYLFYLFLAYYFKYFLKIVSAPPLLPQHTHALLYRRTLPPPPGLCAPFCAHAQCGGRDWGPLLWWVRAWISLWFREPCRWVSVWANEWGCEWGCEWVRSRVEGAGPSNVNPFFVSAVFTPDSVLCYLVLPSLIFANFSRCIKV